MFKWTKIALIVFALIAVASPAMAEDGAALVFAAQREEHGVQRKGFVHRGWP